MSAHHDTGEFIDSDFQPSRPSVPASPPGPGPAAAGAANRPPTREEIEALVSEKQIKLAELKRAQEELERERAGLEELRRRQLEFQTGRGEILHHLTRGVGLLEEAELNTRRDAAEMARTLEEFRDAVNKVQAINEQTWTAENHSVELTRAATIIENARMEWNSGRLKFPLLAGAPADSPNPAAAPARSVFPPETDLLHLCKIGLALTWPLALAMLLGAALLAALLLRR
jgi:hypothetical protein